MKEAIHIIGVILLFLGCSSKQDSTCNKVLVEPFSQKITDTILYNKDKKHIKECYIANVEYFRLNSNKIDQGNLFDPWGCYYANDSLGYVKLTSHTEENIKVYVDDIYYNPTKLISVIFIGVKEDFKQKDIEKSKKGREFTSMCLIGLRNNINRNFVLYPSRLFEQIGYPNYEIPLKIIKEKYFNCLAKTEGAWGKKYRTNLGDKNFWNNNLLFDKVITSESFKYHKSDFPSGEKLYNFQTYSIADMDDKHWGNHYKYDLIDCK